MMTDLIKIRRALISVSDKTGLTEFARTLAKFNIEIISTGGTLAALKKAGIQAVSVSTFTGAPEILGGRVKTLHPKIHAGILFRRDNPDDCAELTHQEYKSIDMVVVNLYPFEKTVGNPKSTEAEIIENIDIGGPSMVRAAAKNFSGVTIITDPADYPSIVAEMNTNDGAIAFTTRRRLAAKAFDLTYRYDRLIAQYFGGLSTVEDTGFPTHLEFSYTLQSKLRYGENPHQLGAFYIDGHFRGPSLSRAEILAGKELSYNNIADMDSCLEMVLDFKEPFACIVKHANPCGAATGKSLADAYRDALASDPLSAFGSIIGLNRKVDMATAQLLYDTEFIECILAPGFDFEALELLKKKKTRRLLSLPEITAGRPSGEKTAKFVRGAILYQTADDHQLDPATLQIASKRKPTDTELTSLLFAWKVVKHTKSNAIVIARNAATVGIGMGQTSRVDASALAVKRAGERAKGAVLASDAFFPMPDGAEVALEAGVTAIIQPGGSKGDPKVIEAVDKAGAAMVFTGVRHFRH